MKRIIADEVYDTETATKIAKTAGEGYTAEVLFKTPHGAWFLFTRGSGLFALGGGNFRPMTPDDAYSWLIRGDHVEIARREFPDRVKDA